MYEYEATVERVVDGDTVDLAIDLGCNVTVHERCRLFGINAPEMRGETKEAGRAARDYLGALIGDAGLLVRTHKDKKGKYGRYLVEIFTGSTYVNNRMIEEGHAVAYEC